VTFKRGNVNTVVK